MACSEAGAVTVGWKFAVVIKSVFETVNKELWLLLFPKAGSRMWNEGRNRTRKSESFKVV